MRAAAAAARRRAAGARGRARARRCGEGGAARGIRPCGRGAPPCRQARCAAHVRARGVAAVVIARRRARAQARVQLEAAGEGRRRAARGQPRAILPFAAAIRLRPRCCSTPIRRQRATTRPLPLNSLRGGARSERSPPSATPRRAPAFCANISRSRCAHVVGRRVRRRMRLPIARRVNFTGASPPEPLTTRAPTHAFAREARPHVGPIRRRRRDARRAPSTVRVPPQRRLLRCAPGRVRPREAACGGPTRRELRLLRVAADLRGGQDGAAPRLQLPCEAARRRAREAACRPPPGGHRAGAASGGGERPARAPRFLRVARAIRADRARCDGRRRPPSPGDQDRASRRRRVRLDKSRWCCAPRRSSTRRRGRMGQDKYRGERDPRVLAQHARRQGLRDAQVSRRRSMAVPGVLRPRTPRTRGSTSSTTARRPLERADAARTRTTRRRSGAAFGVDVCQQRCRGPRRCSRVWRRREPAPPRGVRRLRRPRPLIVGGALRHRAAWRGAAGSRRSSIPPPASRRWPAAERRRARGRCLARSAPIRPDRRRLGISLRRKRLARSALAARAIARRRSVSRPQRRRGRARPPPLGRSRNWASSAGHRCDARGRGLLRALCRRDRGVRGIARARAARALARRPGRRVDARATPARRLRRRSSRAPGCASAGGAAGAPAPARARVRRRRVGARCGGELGAARRGGAQRGELFFGNVLQHVALVEPGRPSAEDAAHARALARRAEGRRVDGALGPRRRPASRRRRYECAAFAAVVAADADERRCGASAFGSLAEVEPRSSAAGCGGGSSSGARRALPRARRGRRHWRRDGAAGARLADAHARAPRCGFDRATVVHARLSARVDARRRRVARAAARLARERSRARWWRRHSRRWPRLGLGAADYINAGRVHHARDPLADAACARGGGSSSGGDAPSLAAAYGSRPAGVAQKRPAMLLPHARATRPTAARRSLRREGRSDARALLAARAGRPPAAARRPRWPQQGRRAGAGWDRPCLFAPPPSVDRAPHAAAATASPRAPRGRAPFGARARLASASYGRRVGGARRSTRRRAARGCGGSPPRDPEARAEVAERSSAVARSARSVQIRSASQPRRAGGGTAVGALDDEAAPCPLNMSKATLLAAGDAREGRPFTLAAELRGERGPGADARAIGGDPPPPRLHDRARVRDAVLAAEGGGVGSAARASFDADWR